MILNQTAPVEKLIVVDNNSTDGTDEFLKEYGFLENDILEYVKLPENIGGAGGFYEGMKIARSHT